MVNLWLATVKKLSMLMPAFISLNRARELPVDCYNLFGLAQPDPSCSITPANVHYLKNEQTKAKTEQGGDRGTGHLLWEKKRQGDMRMKELETETLVIIRCWEGVTCLLDPSVRLKATHGLLLKELKKGERYSLSSLFSLVLDQ